MKVVQLTIYLTDDLKLKTAVIGLNETRLPADKTLLINIARAILDDSEIENISQQVKKQLEKPCTHPKHWVDKYHDETLLCSMCNCIIEQFGEAIDPPTPLV